jgi:hypothetical protein
MRQWVFQALTATWLVAVSLANAAAAVIDYGQLIDMAGRQRMLTQRVIKAYCQVGMQVTPDVSRAQLGAAVARFDSQLAELSKRTTNIEARRALALVAKRWQPYKRVATGPVSRQGANRLLELNDELLLAAHDVVIHLQEAAGTEEARLVNIAGRQRMLSQRLAGLYMLRAFGVNSPAARDALNTAGNEFAGALAALRAASENTPAINAELDAVQLQWEWFRAALSLQGAQSHLLIVADASESILNSMELITGLYAELARR